VEKAAKKWSQEQREKLFDAYFGPSPGLCPICAHEVCMVMTHIGRVVTLLLMCNACNNKASVSHPLPLEGPLHRTAESRAA
jgi:hypothetical protein